MKLYMTHLNVDSPYGVGTILMVLVAAKDLDDASEVAQMLAEHYESDCGMGIVKVRSVAEFPLEPEKIEESDYWTRMDLMQASEAEFDEEAEE
jgi:hypothetical protein